MTAFKIAIPARYASTRLPGKPLRKIAGQPLIRHVYERAVASGAQEVIIATDDERIKSCAQAFGATVCMTSNRHASGSDRLAETARQMGWRDDEIVVNLQGDEPLMPAVNIRRVAVNLDLYAGVDIATLCTSIEAFAELTDPNVVKVVFDAARMALYFSRAPIPWPRERIQAGAGTELPLDGQFFYRHIGLYAYRAGYLQEFTCLPPARLETVEQLEQLRALWHGARIHVDEAPQRPGRGIDTEDDLKVVAACMTADGQASL